MRTLIAQVDLEGGLEEAWSDVVTFAPKLLGFFVILLIGYFVAKALSKLVDTVLERVGFDGLVERGSLKQAFERNKTEPSDIIGVIVFWLVFLIALQLAFGIWGPNPISELLEGLIAYLPQHHRGRRDPGDRRCAREGAHRHPSSVDRVGAGWNRDRQGRGHRHARGWDLRCPRPATGRAAHRQRPFYALLILVVGSSVVAFGVGGIPIARRYLERWSQTVETTARDVKTEVQSQGDPNATMPQPPTTTTGTL